MDSNILTLARAIRELKDRLVQQESEMSNLTEQLVKQVNQVAKEQGPKGEKGEKGDSGKNGKDGKDGKDGEDGISVTDVYIAADGSFVFSLSDGSEVDAGNLPEMYKEDNIIKIAKRYGGNQEVFVNSQPAISYNAVSYQLVAGTDYYTESVNVLV